MAIEWISSSSVFVEIHLTLFILALLTAIAAGDSVFVQNIKQMEGYSVSFLHINEELTEFLCTRYQ